MLKEGTKNSAGIIGQIEVIQHYIKPSCTKNTQYATRFFNSEVKHTWVSSFLLKFKPIINYYLLFYKDFEYLVRNYLISSILLAVCNVMSIKPSIILRIIGKICEHNR